MIYLSDRELFKPTPEQKAKIAEERRTAATAMSSTTTSSTNNTADKAIDGANTTDNAIGETDIERQSIGETELATHRRQSQAAYTSYGKPKSSLVETKRLSTFSKNYDINGDGELDEAELAMKDMDTTGRGYLTNDKVYGLMQDQLKTQQQLFRSKRVTIFLLFLVVLLAISNLGTSFAAAHLAKETTTNESDELVSKSTKEKIATQSTSDLIEIARTTNDATTGERRLCKGNALECQINSYISMSKRDCGRMKRKCARGNTVTLHRKWENGSTSSNQVCPFTSGAMSDYEVSKIRTQDGNEFYYEEDDSGNCKLSGDAITQDEDEICEMEGDCDNGLSCVKIQEKVDRCKFRCGLKRWGPERVVSCENSCDHPSCQRNDEVVD